MRAALLLIGLAACVDAPLPTPDNRHVDIPRGAGVTVAIAAVASATTNDASIATASLTANGVRVTGNREGDAMIEIQHGGALTSVVAHVTAPAIVELAIDPAEMSPLAGTVMAVHAFATDTTGAVADVTDLALWQVEDPTIAALDHGLLRGVIAGETTLHAVIASVSVQLPISVR